MATRRRLTSVPKAPLKQDIVDYARDVIRAEADAVAQLGARLNGAFARRWRWCSPALAAWW